MDLAATVEQVWRQDGGKVLAVLIRTLGDFELAEDALQDALTAALTRWRDDGLPDNPAGWLVTTARRKALDRLRRRATRVDQADRVALVERLERTVLPPDADVPEIPDERLALIFTCCHPALSEQARVALTLRTVAGLTTPEIARCFLLPETTLQQRIVRAKRKIKQAGIPYRVPPRELLAERFDGVLAVLYLVFNEGYSATSGDLVRGGLCREAIRLARVLSALMPDEPEAEGLLALMLLQDSRREARVDGDGGLITLDDQDRTLWRQPVIEEGTALVERALRRRRPGQYQLQAAIAAVHAEAGAAGDTDWWQIVGLYTALYSLLPTPVVALNRAVALAMAGGPELGLSALDQPEVSEPLCDYHLLHAARADLLRRAARWDEAVGAYREALARVTNASERRYLQSRLDEVMASRRASERTTPP